MCPHAFRIVINSGFNIEHHCFLLVLAGMKKRDRTVTFLGQSNGSGERDEKGKKDDESEEEYRDGTPG